MSTRHAVSACWPRRVKVMENYNIYENNNNSENIIISKISYNCAACDAVWTGARKGTGIISYNPATGFITFNKLWGTNPYWWQLLAATICTVPAEDYIRTRDRWRPFKVSTKEGYSGCIYVFLDEYYKSKPLQKYIKDGKGKTLNISVGEKIQDGLGIEFGDLVEMGRALCEWFDIPFTRNPRWWKRGSKDLWRFERLRDFEVTDEVTFDPDLNK